MIYIVREKIFSIGDKFTIKNSNGEDVFQVTSKVLTIGDKLRILDMQGREHIYIEQKLLKFLPQYNIFQGDNLIAGVKKKLTFFNHKFVIESVIGDYEIEGNVLAHDFSIIKNGHQVARIKKAWLSLADCYEVDIESFENPAFILALVIVLDQVIYDDKNNNNNR
ncbi:LURP-one-related/scramblase family protein [Clostridium lundense]|uniref:LURP-one-related/scramblase family protein n=1 Tax=Clostridium lundense TaxID=319475 RepID=UPI0004830E57|nr:LURP-one-related family protein [Clostridium lundense]